MTQLVSGAVGTEAEIDSPTELFVGGRWTGALAGRRFEVLDPATGGTIATVADAGPADAVAAVEAAAEAFPGWADANPRVRGEVLRAAYESMTAEAEDLARLIVAENGKALSDALAEVHYAADFLRWYAEEAVRLDGSFTRAPGGAHRYLVDRRPVGVTALVTPWNFPAAMATRKIGPALAAGCTVLLKPAAETPLTALAVAAHLHRAGAPLGVVNVVPSADSATVVQAMLDHPEVRKLSFTGSTAVGKILLHQAAERVLNTSMELGGNAPFLVLPGADIDEAVEGALVAKMRGGGQACTAANRFFVHRSLAAEFTDKLASRMGKLRWGAGAAPETDYGPLINPAAQQKVQRIVDAAVADGARAVLGGSVPDGPGSFYPATVLADVPPQSAVLAEEIFGPVAPVSTFDDVADAVKWANSVPCGLAGYVFSSNLGDGLRVAQRLEVGMVGLNRGVVSDPAAPFGGVKEAGLGREGGHDGLLEFTETQLVATQW